MLRRMKMTLGREQSTTRAAGLQVIKAITAMGESISIGSRSLRVAVVDEVVVVE